MNLQGKTLFITGGSRGIGLAIAVRAARDGANVVIAAKTSEPHPKLPGTIHTAVAEIEKAGGKGLGVQCDIREEAQVVAAVEKAVAAFGGIDILVNNASAIQLTGTLACDMKRYDLMNGVNARGTYLAGRSCIPHLKKSRTPAACSTRSSMQKLPVNSRLGLQRIACAASAMISGLRDCFIIASPPSICTAAVAMVVRGQSALAAMPSCLNSSAQASVHRLMPYLAMEYATCGANHLGCRSSGGVRVRRCGLRDFVRCGMQQRPAR